MVQLCDMIFHCQFNLKYFWVFAYTLVSFLGFFNAIDENEDGHIDFKELVLGIFTCCRGSTSERLSCKYPSL